MDFECVTIDVDSLALDRAAVTRLPPSARRVYQAIIDTGPATLPELEKETGLARRTVAYAISRLKEERLVAWHGRLDDFRFRYFFVHPRLVQGRSLDGAIIRLDGGAVAPSQRLGLFA